MAPGSNDSTQYTILHMLGNVCVSIQQKIYYLLGFHNTSLVTNGRNQLKILAEKNIEVTKAHINDCLTAMHCIGEWDEGNKLFSLNNNQALCTNTITDVYQQLVKLREELDAQEQNIKTLPNTSNDGANKRPDDIVLGSKDNEELEHDEEEELDGHTAGRRKDEFINRIFKTRESDIDVDSSSKEEEFDQEDLKEESENEEEQELDGESDSDCGRMKKGSFIIDEADYSEPDLPEDKDSMSTSEHEQYMGHFIVEGNDNTDTSDHDNLDADCRKREYEEFHADAEGIVERIKKLRN
jgi:hypothetical protein